MVVWGEVGKTVRTGRGRHLMRYMSGVEGCKLQLGQEQSFCIQMHGNQAYEAQTQLGDMSRAGTSKGSNW
jgi:hypothetical protein